MAASPLPFLTVGLICGAIAIGFLIATRSANTRAMARVGELLRGGASAIQAQQQLVAEGASPQQASEAVMKAIERAWLAQARRLLESGASQVEASAALVARGLDREHADVAVGDAALRLTFRRHPVAFTIGGVVLFVAGAAACLAGLVLRDGNRTGKFVTFPYAGGLAIMVGVGLIAAGCGCLAGWFAGKD